MGSSMNSQEIESRYASLRQARDNGNISDVQFRNDAAHLRLQAPDGFWYQIDPDDGRWLKWNGHTWDKAAIPAALPQVPRKFFPLLGYILKSPGASPSAITHDDFIWHTRVVAAHVSAGFYQPGIRARQRSR